MAKLDINFIREHFPAFCEPSLQGFTHFENAGGSYACGHVIDSLQRYYRETKVQPHYGFEPSSTAGVEMDRARQRMAAWLNVAAEEVQFGPSTSQNTYVVGQALRQHLKPGDEVIVTNQDHEANVGAWRGLEAAGMVVREWRVNPETAELEVAELERLLNDRTRVVAFTHCSNIVGSMHPVREWTDKIHAAGAMAIVDGVSYAPHGLPDVDALGADIYLFSLYKVYGPHLGVMVMREAVNRELPNQGHFFNAGHPTARFTPAGPDHAQIASVNGVLDYFDEVYAHHYADGDAKAARKTSAVRALFQHTERRNLRPLLDFLNQKQSVNLIGKTVTKHRAPTVSFTVNGQTPVQIAAQLASRKIGIANGNCYAYRLMEALDISPAKGVVRVSFVHYTSREEVTRLLEALDDLL
ncbi:MAG: aminotransferase class V-fold PLP-dependent enzyme [Xanthomonadales bacterium]|nr:aminotransferase class V-fold PLP-dependent enzyme [Gammaproteobacteria bacterium]NNK03205.1 aminotransferase class V-fold PLP-dependent enzyme [Xanthomonadales bacterium]